MIVDIDKSTGQKSIQRLLTYLEINSHNSVMNTLPKDHIWTGQIIPYIRSIRENKHFLENPDLQKRQFIKIHDEIMNYFHVNLKYEKETMKQ